MTNATPEIKNKLNMDDENWALVRTPQGSYLAVVKITSKDDGSLDFTMNPAFDYFTSIQATPDGKLQKQAICLPFDTTLDHVDVHILASNVTMVWFKDLSTEDRKKYHQLIKQADEMARASRSGVQLVGNAGR